ncbi:MAG TPA: glycoside hydrolase family 140 protein, partial [Armatimonadota bacterium]|nr:glycoside hydrolase family 140 protein [Armatimonadota bacterium]
VDQDPKKPNEAYFAHVDGIVNLAASLGLHIGMLPTWGDKWNKCWGVGPEIFTPDNAYEYGLFLGRRYVGKPIIWILGGDRAVETENHRAVLRAMAAGLREGDGGEHLCTFHPTGGHTSFESWPDEDWLDFHMWQTGHARNRDCYACITHDYNQSPVKPCMDGEPGYEDHPSNFDLNNGYLEDYDVRKFAYWDVFAGAHGHTYGCHPIWQFWRPGSAGYSFVRRPWTEALQLPGSGQMQYVRALLESRPYFSRIPDQSIVASEIEEGTHHVQATRDADGSYALIYLPSYKPITIDLAKLSGDTINAYWYDPRTGLAQVIASFPRTGQREFTPPTFGPDWVLVLDDAARHYPIPGTAVLVNR